MTEEQKKTESAKKELSVEAIIKFSPFILIFPQIAGGVLGGLCGAIGWSFNEFIFKKDISKPMKYCAAFLTLIGSVGLYILFAAIVTLIFPSLAENLDRSL